MEKTPFYEQVRDRLIRYAKVDTQSARVSDTVPTTKKQFDLAYLLRDELRKIGAADVWLDEDKCVLYGTIPATAEGGMA
ncbi:MAG: peptidase T, partial [Clostridia bacterium]|nr:peptidase T [Clostridia bacterium]